MNKTILISAPKIHPQKGDIFQDRDGNLFILASVGINLSSELFAAISLEDGNRYRDMEPTKEKAILGLIPVGRNAEISLKFE